VRTGRRGGPRGRSICLPRGPPTPSNRCNLRAPTRDRGGGLPGGHPTWNAGVTSTGDRGVGQRGWIRGWIRGSGQLRSHGTGDSPIVSRGPARDLTPPWLLPNPMRPPSPDSGGCAARRPSDASSASTTWRRVTWSYPSSSPRWRTNPPRSPPCPASSAGRWNGSPRWGRRPRRRGWAA